MSDIERKAAFVLCADVLSKALGALAILLIIRLMVTAEYASYTLVLAISGVIGQAMAAASNRVYLISYDEVGKGNGARALVSVQILASGVLPLLIYHFLGLSTALGLALSFLVVGQVVFDFVRTDYQRRLRFGGYACIDLIKNSLFLGLLALTCTSTSVEINAFTVTTFQAVAIGLVSLPLLQHLRLLPTIKDHKALIATLRLLISGENRYLFGYFVMLAIGSQLGVLLLKDLTDDLGLASFGAAFRYYQVLMMGLSAVNAVLLPTIAKAQTKGQIHSFYGQYKRVVIGFTLGCSCLVVAAPWILPIFDQGRYPQSVFCFQILVVSSVISFALSPYANILMRFKDYYFLFVVVCVSMALLSSCTIVFTSRLGVFGAALATLIGYGVLNVAVYIRSRSLLAEAQEVL